MKKSEEIRFDVENVVMSVPHHFIFIVPGKSKEVIKRSRESVKKREEIFVEP